MSKSVTEWFDDRIHEWHTSDHAGAMPLHEFLGLSQHEFGIWVVDPTRRQEMEELARARTHER